jgi:ATP-binding cassette subfamily B protein
MWRLCRLGYRHEPRLMLAAFALAQLSALPGALIALWLLVLGKGVEQQRSELVIGAAIGMGLSSAATWLVGVYSTRVQRRFRDRVTIALEAHVASLQASIVTIAHHERPEYLDRLAMLRNQVFVLDHMYMSLFSTCAWILGLAVTVALLATVHIALILLAALAIPAVMTSTWRPAVERAAQEKAAQPNRLARHLFMVATTAAPGKDVRITGIGDRLVGERRDAWQSGYAPVAAARWSSAGWHAAAWALFAAGYIGAIVFVALGLRAPVGSVLLVLAAGAGLSRFVSGTVGELGFLRGFWMDGSRRLAWLEDYAASITAAADAHAPTALKHGINFDHVSFAYPGTSKKVLEDVTLALPAGSVVAIVGENGAGKTTMVKLLTKMYEPTSGAIVVDGVSLARIRADEWRTRLAGAFQDFFRFEFTAGRTVGLGDVVHLDDHAAVTAAVARAGAEDVVARPDMARWRRTLVRAVAEAGAGARLHARTGAAGGPRRANRRPRRGNGTRVVRALCRFGARDTCARAGDGPGVASLLDRAHGRSHRRPRRRPRRREGDARGANGARRHLRSAVWDPGDGLQEMKGRCVSYSEIRMSHKRARRSGAV